MGAKAVTLSDSDGFVHDPDGIDNEKLAWVMELKNERRGRIAEYAERFPSATFAAFDPKADANPLWSIPAECAFPSATENEINAKDAANMIAGGVFVVSEGANMPTMPEGRRSVRERRDPLRSRQGGERRGRRRLRTRDGAGLTASGVAARGGRRALKQIMKAIHQQCRDTAEAFDVPGNYVHGANIAGFVKVADAMIDQGLV
jgi:glutamate dehydrogenase (NADP+)